MSQLSLLAEHRDDILLAEAIGWLHDYRKCSDEQLQTQAANLDTGQALPRSEANDPRSLSSRHPSLTNVELQLPFQGNARSVTNLLNDKTWRDDALGQLLSRCHGTAHFDKQEPEGGKQHYPGVQGSSPFGWERELPDGLTSRLWSLPWEALASYSETAREQVQRAVQAIFSQTVADTRRPINEVDLWSWGLLVGALYKSALVWALLSGRAPDAKSLRWRLLGVQVGGLDYLLSVARIPDLLARQELLTAALNSVRNLIEVTYPLGSEVYRDENGSVYVVPDQPEVLQIADADGTSLRALILKAFERGTLRDRPDLRLGGEVEPRLELESEPWWGQDPDWKEKTDPDRSSPLYGQPLENELPDIGGFLSRETPSQAHADKIKRFWEGQTTAEICTVCGLRPQGPKDSKAGERKVCVTCERRRADRSMEWATSQPGETIWTSEVADTNGRLALIVGQFDLTHWLDGSLLESLLLVAPSAPQNTDGKPVTSKTPSFSRLRRIWETTHDFWKEAQAESMSRLTDDRRRLRILLDALPDLGPYHVYDLELGATDLGVVWVPPDSGESGYLLSADNLGYVARQLGAEEGVYGDPATAAIFIEDFLREQFIEAGRQPILSNPDASASEQDRNLLGQARIVDVAYQRAQYATTIPILSEPRTFMMLVSADKSLDVLQVIKEKYEREMGKVRDRLPIHLGIVYARRRTPIRAVLDAGRAMLESQTSPQQWTVEESRRVSQTDGTHFNDVALLELRSGDRRAKWRIPLRMGDGTTEDRWYPYVFLETEDDDARADASNRRAVRVARPTGDVCSEECWIVHAADLRGGDVIHVWPSTFDFEFLDTTGRRFEIAYDEAGRRRGRPTRPFLLEEVDRLEQIWELLGQHLETTQWMALDGLIEQKRQEWGESAEKGWSQPFEKFVVDCLRNADWKAGWTALGENQEVLEEAALSGTLHDTIDLYHEAMKQKPEKGA